MDQEQYWKNNQREYQYIPVEDFAESFCFYYLETLLEEEHTPTSTAKGGKTLAMSESYIISNWEVLKSCFIRELLLLKRNSLVHIFKNVQIMILAFVAMTLFLRTNMDYHSIIGGNKFLGAIFAAVVIVKFNGMTELQMIVRRLPVFYKQRQLLHLPGWALLFSVYILGLPMSLIETGKWTSLTYFVIGYAPSATSLLLELSNWTTNKLLLQNQFLIIKSNMNLLAQTYWSKVRKLEETEDVQLASLFC